MNETLQNDYSHLMNTYRPQPVELVRGEGAYVWDVTGRRFLDFVAGIAVNNLGHCHPAVVDAVRRQAETLIHVSNLYRIPVQAELAELLCDHSFAWACFFCNSGAEAVEAAVKLARRYGIRTKGEGASGIVAAKGSFHGRTMGAMTATGQERIHSGFGPLVPGFSHVPFGNAAALEEEVGEDTAAVILEPIQGESGVVTPPDGYLSRVREICDREGALLIFDEIQTGMGRTGTLFAYERFDVKPDVMVLAKGLAGGLPMGACLAGDRAASVFEPGSHASTFGGNPLVSAASCAALRATLSDGVLENCVTMGEYFMNELRRIAGETDLIAEVRGVGLMIGVELTRGGPEVVDAFRERNILVNCTAERVLRFLPPLIVTKDEVDEVTSAFKDIIGGL
ncbi:MAG: acetylornithine transaminase [Deltaproteobacteria bacterium]|nr:acetylornithine transaminase [Candidatus Zymogenaceae bacterium]